MTFSVIGNLAIAAILLFFLYRLQEKHVSFGNSDNKCDTHG